jgi:hypothetical protein
LVQKKARLHFYVDIRSNLSSFVKRDDLTEFEVVDVPMMTIDDFVQDGKTLDLIRMDVEGYETEILKGGEKTLMTDRAPKYFFIEVHCELLKKRGSGGFEIAKYLRQFGYEVDVGFHRGSDKYVVTSMKEFEDHPMREVGYWEIFFRLDRILNKITMSGFLAFTTKMLKRYGRGGMLLLLLQAVTVAIQIVVMPFLARLLTPSEFGIFQFSQNLITWFSIFSVGNSTLAAKKGMVENKNGTILYAFLYRLKFMAVLCALSFAAAGVFFFLGKPILPELSMIVGLFLFFGYLAQVSFPQMFIAKENFGLFVFWQSVAIFVSQACTLAVAYTTKNVTLVIFAQYASMALICGLAFIFGLKKYHCIAAYKKGEIDRSCVDYGKKLIPVEILQGDSRKYS